MADLKSFYTRQNLWKSFKVALAVALWVGLLGGVPAVLPYIIWVAFVTVSGPAIMAHRAALNEEE